MDLLHGVHALPSLHAVGDAASCVALLFTITGFLQMAVWAMKKHRGYLKTYGDAYKKLHRKAIVPFIY